MEKMTRNSRTIALLDDVKIVGRATANVQPRQELSLTASGESQEIRPGGKCEHGVYIPASFLYADRAPDCSICRPYEILAKSTHKA